MLRFLIPTTVFLLAQQVSFVSACSCIGPITLESTLQNAPYAARIMVKDDITVNRGSNINAPLFFSATVIDVFNGCDISFGEDIVITTGGNSALCGVTGLKENTEYFLSGALREGAIDQIEGTVKLLSISICRFLAPWESLSNSQMVTLDETNPDCEPTYPTLTCKECPCGYFDGCNSCNCVTGSTTAGACTKKLCFTQLPPKCRSCPVACPADAKQCPDGSFVGRDSENNCEFKPCPEVLACTADVKQCPDGSFVARDPKYGCAFAPCPIIACPADIRLCPDGSTVTRDPKDGCKSFEPCPEVLACTADVKQCPDGSFVARDPKNGCAFDQCPSVPKGCGELTGCVLTNLDDNTSVNISPSSVTSYKVDKSADYSVECKVDGKMNKVTFTPETGPGDDHTEWRAPFWFNGDSNGSVNPAEYFKTCGKTGFKVVGEVWRGVCFQQKFRLLAEC